MMLRAKGANLSWLTSFRVTPKGPVVSAAGARTIPQALRAIQATKLNAVKNVAFNKLPLPRVLGGTAIGAMITFGPQMYFDASETGVLTDPKNAEAWRNFAIKSAGSQSANAIGVAAAFGAGLLLVGASAPVVIVVSFLAGVAVQGGFNAFGLNEKMEDAAHWLLRD